MQIAKGYSVGAVLHRDNLGKILGVPSIVIPKED